MNNREARRPTNTERVLRLLLLDPGPPDVQQQVLDEYECGMQKLEAEVARLRAALQLVTQCNALANCKDVAARALR